MIAFVSNTTNVCTRAGMEALDGERGLEFEFYWIHVYEYGLKKQVTCGK